jgi:hypothetical protein
MDELAKGLFGNKLLQGAFPMTQEDAYIHKANEETDDEQAHTPVGQKERPDAYRRNFNDPDEASPDEAEEESPEESPESPEATPEATPEESPGTPMTPEATAEQTIEATPEPETPVTPPEMTPEGTPMTAEQTIEATPEPETPVTPPAPGTPEQDEAVTPEQDDARARGRQAFEDARARLNGGGDAAEAAEAADDEEADAAAQNMGTPGGETPGAETPMGETPVPGTPAEGGDPRGGKPLPSDGNTTIGNFLISTIHAGFTVAADRAFGAGRMTQDERIAISSAISEALKTFSRVLDEQHSELRDREMPSALAVLAH